MCKYWVKMRPTYPPDLWCCECEDDKMLKYIDDLTGEKDRCYFEITYVCPHIELTKEDEQMMCDHIDKLIKEGIPGRKGIQKDV
jgi:hypothetical protein